MMLIPRPQGRCGKCGNNNGRTYCRTGRRIGAANCGAFTKRKIKWTKLMHSRKIKQGIRLARIGRPGINTAGFFSSGGE